MVVTNNAELARQCRFLREYGWAERYISSMQGWNTRLDEMQAAVLRIKLRGLDKDNDLRHRIAQEYGAGLAECGLSLPLCRSEGNHIYHLFVIRLEKRNELQAFLKSNGIGTLVHYPVPVHLQPAYKGRLPGSDSLPQTEKIAGEILSLPMYPELSLQNVQIIINAIKTFLKE